ncbi:unnamed protein product [Trichogramma brassicae]|uniref:Uncharacterized protein n=1 Tax=Trichogramma brassicae TaxID=86971 RepID=A0A6H5IHE0_9HYME|nr:unnamed protein product [Trichogramma brassicae]
MRAEREREKEQKKERKDFLFKDLDRLRNPRDRSVLGALPLASLPRKADERIILHIPFRAVVTDIKLNEAAGKDKKRKRCVRMREYLTEIAKDVDEVGLVIVVIPAEERILSDSMSLVANERHGHVHDGRAERQQGVLTAILSRLDGYSTHHTTSVRFLLVVGEHAVPIDVYRVPHALITL